MKHHNSVSLTDMLTKSNKEWIGAVYHEILTYEDNNASKY